MNANCRSNFWNWSEKSWWIVDICRDATWQNISLLVFMTCGKGWHEKRRHTRDYHFYSLFVNKNKKISNKYNKWNMYYNNKVLRIYMNICFNELGFFMNFPSKLSWLYFPYSPWIFGHTNTDKNERHHTDNKRSDQVSRTMNWLWWVDSSGPMHGMTEEQQLWSDYIHRLIYAFPVWIL